VSDINYYDEIKDTDSDIDDNEFDDVPDIISEDTDYSEIDRITIFKHLSIDQITNTVNMSIFENLLNDYYSDFISFCDQVKSSPEKIGSVTCYIKYGKLEFDLQLEEKD